LHKLSLYNQDTEPQSVFEYYSSYHKDKDPLTSSKTNHVGMCFHARRMREGREGPLACTYRFVPILPSELALPLELLVLAFLICPVFLSRSLPYTLLCLLCLLGFTGRFSYSCGLLLAQFDLFLLSLCPFLAPLFFFYSSSYLLFLP
jgi:hypothetical protein